jgi:hypothetical protein
MPAPLDGFAFKYAQSPVYHVWITASLPGQQSSLAWIWTLGLSSDDTGDSLENVTSHAII